MMTDAPPLFLVAILVLLAAGLVILAWGRSFAKYCMWMAAAGVVVLFGLAAFGWHEMLFDSPFSRAWFRGWILPRNEHGAVTVGLYEDPLGFVTMMVIALVAGFTLLESLNRKQFSPGSRPERGIAAIALSAAGMSLAWVSLTPWLALIGISLTALAGFLGLGAKWGESDKEASGATRFAWEKWWGIILAWFGAGILADARGPMTFHSEISTEAQNYVPAIFTQDEVGVALLILGLFVQLQGFPFMGWVISPGSTAIVPRVFLNQLGPGFAAIGLLMRLEPHLRTSAVFEVFGWGALGSAFVSLVIGVLQSTWRQSLAAWIAGGFAISASILVFAGPPGGYGFTLGLLLGALVLAAAISALGEKRKPTTGVAGGPGWLRGIAFVAAGCGTGVAGFVSGFGILHWIASESMIPGWAALPMFVYFVFILSGWSLAWGAVNIRPGAAVAWYQIVAQVIVLLGALAVVWTGTLTGGYFAGAEVVTSSLVEMLFDVSTGSVDAAGRFVWVYLALQFFGFALAFWMVGRSRDHWLALREGFPRPVGFVSSGLGLAEISGRVYSAIVAVGQGTQWLFESILWDKGIARVLSRGIDRSTRVARQADEALTRAISSGLARALSAPAKFLQLVQNGDVQWYLIFAIGSSVAILLHFLIAKEWL